MNFDFIKNRIKNEEDLYEIEKAFNFTNKLLLDTYGVQSELLINHILQVVNTLIDFNADSSTLCGCILYETVKHGIDKKELEKEFGDSIASIAFIASKINSYESVSIDEEQRSYLEQLNVESPEDVRALFIKLATNFYILKQKENLGYIYQTKTARETFDILIPIAERLRLNFIKSKLEDLCLSYLNPEAYNDILNKLNATPDVLKKHLNTTKEDILNLLSKNNITCTVKGRVKNIYSIHNKLMNGKTWEEIYDILALRIIVEDESHCSIVAQLIHSQYSFLPSRFKDYINNPKENMYQSLHTTIIDKNNRFFEIQIRTNEMNKNAEVGKASHQSYKEKTLKKKNSN